LQLHKYKQLTCDIFESQNKELKLFSWTRRRQLRSRNTETNL
jgi:hypothetical protein